MTKFILHGGETSIPCENNDSYYKEILASTPGPAKILLVYFAIAKERWPENFNTHKKLFLAQAGNKKIEFALASPETREFAKQIKNNGVIFIRGGDTLMLQRQLEKVANFGDLLKGKVVAGSSAGALVLAKYYYNQDYGKILEGFDILHVKIITHYLSPKKYAATSGEDKLRKLENYKEKLPVCAIKETEHIIIEK
ncbi:MAG: Type 1 glutamine amidotransferase-like domain-containing protein [Parcubacteria group bacterium]|jgi:peptidase E